MTKGYPGSKGASGVAEQIISQMPAHQVYVEAFAGHAAVLRRKLPAADRSYVIDADPQVCNWLANRHDRPRACTIILGDVLWEVRRLADAADASWLLYADPPYLMSTRSSQRRYYRHEFHTPDEHADLLELLLEWPGFAMVSGYPSRLYDSKLAAWRKHTFTAGTRGGQRVECLWMNFDPAALELHDTRFVGANYRERERIKRKRQRWERRLAEMPPAERQVIADALAAVMAAPSTNTPAVDSRSTLQPHRQRRGPAA